MIEPLDAGRADRRARTVVPGVHSLARLVSGLVVGLVTGVVADHALAHPPNGLAVAPDGSVFVPGGPSGCVYRVRPDGSSEIVLDVERAGEEALLRAPHHCFVNEAGELFVASDHGPSLWRVGVDGVIERLEPGASNAGDDDALAISSGGDPFLREPDGSIVLLVDQQHRTSRLARVAPDGTRRRIVGGAWGWRDGSASEARLGNLHGATLVRDARGRLLFTDSGSRLRRVERDGSVRTIAGPPADDTDGAGRGPFRGACGVAVMPDGTILVADVDARRIHRVSEDGARVEPFAGSGRPGDVDGAALDACFNEPAGVVVEPDGAVYVLDSDAPRELLRIVVIRDGMARTIARVSSAPQPR